MFDVGFSALIEDLDSRGLLDETLVVAIAEFGRTPKINPFGGRDHWGHVFSFVMAGAGISGGQVYGSSDKTGGYPLSARVQPQELTATIFHLLGIGHEVTFRDRTGRPLAVSKGEPLWKLLGTSPATTERVTPGGDLALVPAYDDRQIVDTDFESAVPLTPHGSADRHKRWQASPVGEQLEPGALTVALQEDTKSSRSGRRHAVLGFAAPPAGSTVEFTVGQRAMLSQEVRSPRAGRFTFSAHAACASSDAAFYREVFSKHFACRLVIFGFLDLKKDHREQRRFATIDFQPTWSDGPQARYEKFSVSATLRSQDGGAMETSRGIGVAIVVECVRPLSLPASNGSPFAMIHIDDVELVFDPRPRDDSVTV